VKGLLYTAHPNGCRHKLYIPAEAKALPREGASALMIQQLTAKCISPTTDAFHLQQHTSHLPQHALQLQQHALHSLQNVFDLPQTVSHLQHLHLTYHNMHHTNSLTSNEQQHASAQRVFATFPDTHKEGEAIYVVSFLPMVATPRLSKAATLQWHADSSHTDVSCCRCHTDSVTAAGYLCTGCIQVSSMAAC